ncbi:hypothetical protein ES704_02046 [subsurface metagenome]|jgi:hypothetical protein
MKVSLLKTSHEDLFLDQGHLLALGFFEGWACFRIKHREWANLEPWSLGGITALNNLAAYNEVQDSQSRHYLEPHTEDLIYHSFWGVTPTRARIYVQYPPRADVGSVLAVPRSETGDIGYIDGDKSPYEGPFSNATELFTVKEKYPAFQGYNPLNDDMDNVLLNFDQRHYSYQIIKNPDLIRSILIGTARAKKYTMGSAWPNVMTLPDWLKSAIGAELLKATLKIMDEGGA